MKGARPHEETSLLATVHAQNSDKLIVANKVFIVMVLYRQFLRVKFYNVIIIIKKNSSCLKGEVFWKMVMKNHNY